MLFDLNSKLNNLFESLSTKDFLVDSLASFLAELTMQLCVLEISTKTLKFSLAGLILMNSQPNSFSSSFCPCISWLISLFLYPTSSTSIASL